jgi:hypothetical protein
MTIKNAISHAFVFLFIFSQQLYAQRSNINGTYERCSVSPTTLIDINTDNRNERSGRVGISCIGGISGYVDSASIPREMTFQVMDGHVSRVISIPQDTAAPISFSDIVDQNLDSGGRSTISQALRRAGVPRGASVRLVAAALSGNVQINSEPRGNGNTMPLTDYIRRRSAGNNSSYGLYPCQYSQKTILNLGRGACGSGEVKICQAEMSCMQLDRVTNRGNVRVSAACRTDRFGLCPVDPHECIADSNVSLNPESQSVINQRINAILMDGNVPNQGNVERSNPVDATGALNF